jgi:hypothetical protein
MRKGNNVFIQLLKKYTLIDHNFIDTFFRKFKIGDDLEFHIHDVDVANYLKIKIRSLRKRLGNHYTKDELFFPNVDYIRIKNPKTSSASYMLNYKCFERIAMSSRSKESANVRYYFSQLRDFIYQNQNVLMQAMDENRFLKKLRNQEVIYFFVIDKNHPKIVKIGRSADIVRRLSTYNVGRIKNVDLKYLAIVKKSDLIEDCIKTVLKPTLIKDHEIFKVDLKKLKNVIENCYKKYISKQSNNKLFKAITDLLNFYNFSKASPKYEPYAVIDQT